VPNLSAELPGAPTVKLNGGAPVPGVTSDKLMGALMFAVTGWLAAAGTTTRGITVMVADLNLRESLFDVAVSVTVRGAARALVGGL